MDSVATEAECSRAAAAAWEALQTTNTISLPLDVSASEELFGAPGHALLSQLRERMTKQVRRLHHAPEATPVGTLVTCITGSGTGTGAADERHGSTADDDGSTYAPHVDIANRPEYEISALLYLNGAEVDYDGGLFAFHDADADRLVVPRAGRLLSFCSGFHNLHRVEPVTRGRRFVLSVWYRRGSGGGGGGGGGAAAAAATQPLAATQLPVAERQATGGTAAAEGIAPRDSSDGGAGVGGTSGDGGPVEPPPLAAHASPKMDADGFELARGAVRGALCAELRGEVLRQAEAERRSWRLWLDGMLGRLGLGRARPIRAARHRQHVALRLTPTVEAAVSAAASALVGGGAAGRGGLSSGAKLVELSAMISRPGAARQDAHTDVPPQTRRAGATLWVALQDVDRSMGPTAVHGGSVAELAARVDWAALEARAAAAAALGKTFAPDGEPAELSDSDYDADGAHKVAAGAAAGEAGGAAEGAVATGVDGLGLREAVAVEMGAGDAMLLDLRTFHFGTRNASGATRVQLSATFRETAAAEAAADAQVAAVDSDAGDGFTYALRPELVGKRTLGDFVAMRSPTAL